MSLLAHELRTPLTFLSGFSGLLAARNDLPEQAKEMAAELHDQTEQMVELTERLLELTRLQSGRLSLTWHWADINDLIESQVAQFGHMSYRHDISFLHGPDPVRLRIDTTRIAQAIAGLLKNAINFSPDGGEITVTLAEDADEAIISVKDPGLGIPLQAQGKIFNSFYRVQQPEIRGVEGVGLGLTLAKAIIGAHAGRIWVESKPGEGSTFFIALSKRDYSRGA
jgi:signal transduction histidine kinase